MNITRRCDQEIVSSQTSADPHNCWTRHTRDPPLAKKGDRRHTDLVSGSRPRVQDDSRERQVASLCALRISDRRDGPDAFDQHGNPFEIKSATNTNVTTARDVGLHTIEVWRSKYWIIAVGENLSQGFRIDRLWACHPDDLEVRFKEIESDLAASWKKCQQVLDAATRGGVDEEIFVTVRNLLQRGITKNNPKIPLHVVERNGLVLPHEDPQRIRAMIEEFTSDRPLAVHSGNQTKPIT